MKTEIEVNLEPLPGYRLIEHLGSGGYGEVWRAEAPGGLTKAIKFVFGQQHEKRASNELRALERIRGVRHPFLLSLERIEVVDGRLVVVTELADGSLKDRFEACRRESLIGIPRNELLSYLRDAADALDFMSESHELQHLDVKPENLLLLAGHVKVADFGLVKDVRHSQASLVGGMTPLYAAPEVFRGTPSRHSDQYSLAIVYQEMLTGTLPFMGSNAAELTLQHLNDEPELSALSSADRYAVARALAKDPPHRYATCREFIDVLCNANITDSAFSKASSSQSEVAEPSDYAASPRQAMPTDAFDVGDAGDWVGPPRQLLVELPAPDARLVDLPPIELQGRDERPVPTLVVGIGGTAGRVLTHLRRLIRKRLNSAALPAVQFLLLDTDARGLADATRGDGLTHEEILNLPLRRPQHYRDNSQQILGWLSRRWLYNIPRSLQTEGLRPLGRLAFADHARQTGQRIRRALMQACDPESLADASNALGKEFRGDSLRVCVVASISGGTGSGMSLDIGYAIRAILEKLGVSGARVHGLMMHSTGGDPRHCELARVNAYSWLTEFHHFEQTENSYPGDSSCGLPAHPAGVPAFDDTYLLHLGESLNSVELDQATHAVAEYLCLNALSPAFFDACRQATGKASQTDGGKRTIRSFGWYQRAGAPDEFCDEFAGLVSQQVLARWRGSEVKHNVHRRQHSPLHGMPTPGKMTGDRIESGANFMRRLQLDTAGIIANARSLVEFELGSETDAYLSAWLAAHGTSQSAEPERLQAINAIFGSAELSNAEQSDFLLLGKRPEIIVEPFVEKLRGDLRRWIMKRLDDPCDRLSGTRSNLQWIDEQLRALHAELRQRLAALLDQLLEVRREVAAAPMQTDNPHRTQAYFHLRLEHFAMLAAGHAVQVLLSECKTLADDITALGREIDQIAATVSRSVESAAAGCEAKSLTPAGRTAETDVAAKLLVKVPTVAETVDARLQSECIHSLGGLFTVVMQGGRPRAQLAAKLQEFSRQAVSDAVARIATLESELARDDQRASNELRSGLAAATPALLAFGGKRRVLTVVPRHADNMFDQSTLADAIGTAVTVVVGLSDNLTLCVEAEDISLPHVAAEFVERRRDRIEFAARVHCRNDISWTPLIAAGAGATRDSWPGEEAIETESQQALCQTMVM